MAFHRQLYRVAQKLRYRPLPDLIGRSLVIASLDQVVDTVRAAFGLGPPMNPTRRFEGMVAKYGLLDLEFHSNPPRLSRQDRGGVPLLKEMYFVQEDRTDENLEEEGWCLEELEKSISDQEKVKLFLRSDMDLDSNPLRAKGILEPSALPATFVVEDACLTNASYIWFNEHFYL